MDNPRFTQPIIPILISIFLAVILFLLTEDFVRTVIFMPVLRVIWFISLVINSLPQGAIWAGAIVLLIVFSITAIPAKFSREKSRNPEITPTKGQVEKWAQFLENGQKNPFSMWLLAKELKRFTRKLFSNSDGFQPYHTDFSDVELPDEINAFFNASQPSNNQDQNEQPVENALDLDPEIVIQSLQEKMKS